MNRADVGDVDLNRAEVAARRSRGEINLAVAEMRAAGVDMVAMFSVLNRNVIEALFDEGWGNASCWDSSSKRPSLSSDNLLILAREYRDRADFAEEQARKISGMVPAGRA